MPDSYVRIGANLGTARRSHVWRTDAGNVTGSVDLGEASGLFYIAFQDPADARAMAAEIVAVAEQMENFPPDEEGAPDGSA